jgi:hypothetical protein
VVVRELVPREALRVAAPLRPAALRLAEVLFVVVPLVAAEFVVVAMWMVNPSRCVLPRVTILVLSALP